MSWLLLQFYVCESAPLRTLTLSVFPRTLRWCSPSGRRPLTLWTSRQLTGKWPGRHTGGGWRRGMGCVRRFRGAESFRKTFPGLQLFGGCAFGDTHSSGFCRPSELLVCSQENIRDCPADPATRTAPSSPSPRHRNSLSTGGTTDNHHSVNTTVSFVSILIP